MSAAGEGAVRVNDATSGAGIEHGTRTVRRLKKPFAACSAEGLHGEQRFGIGKPWSGTRMAELAALRTPDTIAFDWTGGKIGIYLPHRRAMATLLRSCSGVWNAGIEPWLAFTFGEYNPSEKGVCASDSRIKMDPVKTETKRPIIINGAGPVGLTMACELARHGVGDPNFRQKRGAIHEIESPGDFSEDTGGLFLNGSGRGSAGGGSAIEGRLALQ